ncbi:lytic transglycosylase domain-containing protein [Acinetobacter sp. HY1485]|uniref:lytic transglycosylase domain-containing protein n=1 Tax=Acinetobacter sp. HY1485 TaxID=2970918 RepID=UPI0022B95D06|nr:lytic transglycosylase domain-containing protein [Acinetobacter sp. HY1485]
MATWLNDANTQEQDEQQATLQTDLGNAVAPKKEAGFFDGAGSAFLRGGAVGVIKVGNAVMRPLEAVGDRLAYSYQDSQDEGLPKESFDEFQAKRQKKRDDLTYAGIDMLEDKENTGTLGNIALSLGDYTLRGGLGAATGGALGAASLTAGSTGDYVYHDLVHKGVDKQTALQVATTNAVVDGVGTFLPASYGFKGTGGLLKDAAVSVGGAAGLSQGGQAISHAVLSNNGYDKESKQYEFTGEGLATDLILGGLLFGGARYMGRKSQDLTDTQYDARQDATQQVLHNNETEVDNSALNTADKPTQEKHYQNLDVAREQMNTAQPVNVPHEIKQEQKATQPINYNAYNLSDNAKLIANKAQQAGIDPSIALTISHIETGGTFQSRAQNPTSSANGLFQVLDSSWKRLGGQNRADVNEQIRIGLKHIEESNKVMRKGLGRDPSGSEFYLGHLLGPSGAVKVLKADQSRPLIDVVRQYDAKNANDIVNNNAMKGLTVGQALQKWQGKWNNVSSRYGGNGISRVNALDGSAYDFSYEVHNLDDLITSNDRNLNTNPAYPAELQPRDRTRTASKQQIEDMANDLKPELLAESPKISDGAPIIGHDNAVESGNGRTLAIGRAYEDGKADAYRSYVEDYATQRGLDISGIDNPVLVRRRLTDTDRVQFARLANESDVAHFSSTERASTDADRLPDASLLKLNQDGHINLDGSMDYVRQFLSALPKSEQGSLMTGDGRLSQDGKRRIESALVHKAYNDPNLVARLSEHLDDDSKTVLNSLLRVAPQIAQLGDLVKQGGRHSNTIAQDLAQAAQKLSDIKSSGSNVRDYLNQGQLVDDGLSTGARDYLNVFAENNRSAKAITENIQNKLDEVEAMGDPRQGSLFGETPEQQSALNIITQQPDQLISVSRERPDGQIEEITMTLRERLDELEAETKQADEDILATQTALSCALQFGE